MLPVVRQLLTALRHKCPPSQPHGHQLNAESRPASALRPNNMTRTRRPIALFLMLSSLHWLGSSLDLSNPAASSDEDPAVNSRDAPKRPVLQPKETAPPQSTYTLKNLKGQVCVRARLGGEYVVRENKGCGPGQDNLLNSKLNVRMGKKGDLNNFERGMVVGV
ncbi:hypothetical protein F2P79_025881 [Pimephales promelas]|nr:hypothetical protein F2P79_025881 [Pimephales promelas]